MAPVAPALAPRPQHLDDDDDDEEDEDEDEESVKAVMQARADASLDKDGFACRPLLQSEPQDRKQLERLKKLLATDRASPLKVAAAWKIDNPGLRSRYNGGRDKLITDMERLDNRGKLKEKDDGSFVLPGLPVKTSKARHVLKSKEEQATEVVLLHGTSPNILLTILSEGCNERFSGMNAGTRFGDGICEHVGTRTCRLADWIEPLRS